MMKLKILLHIFVFKTAILLAIQQSYNSRSIEANTILETQHKHLYLLPLDSILKQDVETENTIYPKNFNPQFQDKYRSDDFDYTIEPSYSDSNSKNYSLILRILKFIFGGIDPLNPMTTIVLKILLTLLGVVVLYFLIRFFTSKNGKFFFEKQNKKINIKSRDLQENIHEINFQKSILESEKNKDYRSAIRYYFLYLLKKLSDNKLIYWDPEKTNRDYYTELKDPNLKAQYEKLSYIFDNVWYGEFTVNQAEYQLLAHQFEKSGFF